MSIPFPVSFRFRNRHGTPVDPVPFLVVSLLGVPVTIGWGPPYFMAWGLGFPLSIAASVALAVGVAVVAFHRYVWTARPSLTGEVPVALRLQRLLYAIAAGIALLLALGAAPLLLR